MFDVPVCHFKGPVHEDRLPSCASGVGKAGCVRTLVALSSSFDRRHGRRRRRLVSFYHLLLYEYPIL